MRVEQLGSALVIAPHLLVLVERDAGPVGEEAHGVDEVEVVHGPHEVMASPDAWQPKQ